MPGGCVGREGLARRHPPACLRWVGGTNTQSENLWRRGIKGHIPSLFCLLVPVPPQKPEHKVETAPAKAEARGAAFISPAFKLQGKCRRGPEFVKGHSPGNEGLAAGGAGGGAGWGGTRRIRRGFGEGDGPNGTHLAVAVAGEELQVSIIEFNLTFHVTCYYVAARKRKLLINALIENSQMFLG